jgi:hypothetical protein
MPHAKNQHYVARLYLRQFAYEAGKNPHIYAFDKTTRRIIRPTIRNIAAHLHFYESSDTGVENALQAVESAFVPAYQKLREADSIEALGAEDRAAIAMFLAVQQLRTIEYRAQVRSSVAELKRWLDHYGYEHDPALTTITEEQCRQIQILAFVKSSPEIADVMGHNMKWIRLRNRTQMPYWTSDHPITPYNPRPVELAGNMGLKCRGIQVFVPLSPSLALCLCDPIDYATLPTDAVIDDVQNVVFQNDLQVRTSTRFLFANSGDFALANQVLEHHPQFGDPDRRRSHAVGVP